MAALSTVRAVEIARVGTWHASTGVWECTREQLQDAVRAQDDPAFRAAILKIGHTDERFNGADGEPAVGRVTNLRLSADGEALVADFEQVPTWLAEIIPSAYPSRSVEMFLNVAVGSTTYAAVLTGVALLGVTAPAIEALADVATLYQQPTAVDAWVAAGASRVAASFASPAARPVWPPLPDLSAPLALSAPTGGTMPTTDPTTTTTPGTPAADPATPARVAAAASIEGLRTAFYEWVATPGDERGDLDGWAWICEVWTDALIVDDDEGHLWRVTWTESNGAFAFGSPQKVTRTYVPVADTITAGAAWGMHRPVRYFRGRGDVSASTPEETPAVSSQTEIAQALRERLGLGADVDDTAVLTALDERLAPKTPADSTPAGEGATPADPTTTTTPAAPVAEAVAASAEVATLKASVETYRDELKAATAELAQIKAAKAAEHKARVIGDAVKAGKITPADKAKWETRYDAAPASVEEILADIQPGTAVPVQASGSVGSEPTTNTDDERAYQHVAGLLTLKRGEG
jgi:hypothetical protein